MTDQEELQRLKALRVKIIGALDGALENADVENYSFGDGNGNQSVRRRNPQQLLDMLKELDKQIDVLERAALGGGVRTLGMNRYG
jgi:hypothetical protein